MTVFYKVRRKSDGKYARNWRLGIARFSEAGQTFSEKALHHAKRLLSCLDYKTFASPGETELVKFTIVGTSCIEEVIATSGGER